MFTILLACINAKYDYDYEGVFAFTFITDIAIIISIKEIVEAVLV